VKHLDASQYPVVTVKFSTSWLCVNVAACHDSREVIIAASTTGKNIANCVNPDGAACGLGLSYKIVTALAI
jgi:citrate lyase synthetase